MLHVVVVVFFFEYNKSWTSVNSILLRYNGVGIFNCRSFGTLYKIVTKLHYKKV